MANLPALPLLNLSPFLDPMKKLFSIALLVAMMLGLPSPSMAKGRKRRDTSVSGEVTAVGERTLTIQEGKRGTTKTIFVPAAATIQGGGGGSSSSSSSSSGGPPSLSGLVGKHVRVKEAAAGTAKEITVMEPKGTKKTKKA